ncbi:hypothetical protein D3C76_172690 [compost metagenome]
MHPRKAHGRGAIAAMLDRDVQADGFQSVDAGFEPCELFQGKRRIGTVRIGKMRKQTFQHDKGRGGRGLCGHPGHRFGGRQADPGHPGIVFQMNAGLAPLFSRASDRFPQHVLGIHREGNPVPDGHFHPMRWRVAEHENRL